MNLWNPLALEFQYGENALDAKRELPYSLFQNNQFVVNSIYFNFGRINYAGKSH
jgi:hypothetical protein